MPNVIEVNGISKRYYLGGRQSHSTLRDLIVDRATSPLRRSERDEFWALKDINFSLTQGDTLGIIGRNGAGKSTLLKILSRITKPTSGEARIHGRVASLLEVGTGFHSELSGKENIFLNGAILGMRRREILGKFDEIVAFAEIGKFIDTPVKHYSSGMYMRLAFAVAAHLEPEILIVDEVLAVGDAEFQKKCLGKMNEVSRTGRTIIFVSHQMGSVAQLCQSAILLEKGNLVMKDTTAKVIGEYLAMGQNSDSFYAASENETNKAAYFEYVKMVNERGEVITSLEHDKPLILEFSVKAREQTSDLILGFSLQDAMQKRIFTIHQPLKDIVKTPAGSRPVRLTIPGDLLTPGQYSWIVAAFAQGKEMSDVQRDICSFSIIDAGTEFANYEGVDYGCVFVHDYTFEPVP